MVRFDFAIDPRFLPLLLPFGVRSGTAWLQVDGDIISVRFGFFSLRTTIANVTGFQTSGGYKAYRAIGVRSSLADRGVTFGSNTRAGLCVTFAKPVEVQPGFGLRHPGMTVTVADIDGLATFLEGRGITRHDA